MRKAVLEADFGRSREPVNGLRFDVLAPLTTPTHHSDAPAAAIFALDRQHRGSLVNIFSIFLPQSTGKPVASMKKKVACQIAVNVLLSSATRSRKPVS